MSKLQEERSLMQRKIQNELKEAWADPNVQNYFKERVQKEETNRNLQELENKRKMVETEITALVDAVAEEISPELMSQITELGSEFKAGERTVFSDLGNYIEKKWNQTRSQFKSELSSLKDNKGNVLSSPDVINMLDSLNVKFDEDMQDMLMTYVKNKVEKNLKDKESRLRKLIQEPIDTTSEAILLHARKVDVAESIAINSIYKLANFLNKGEFEISFWQKFSIFAKNFKISDLQSTFQSEQNWENLCLKIKAAIDKGNLKDIENIPKEVDQFFTNEQKKMENAYTAMEEAIENIMKEENGEEVVRRIMDNAAKEVEKHLEKKYESIPIGLKVVQTAKRVEAVAGHFEKIKSTMESIMPKDKKEEKKVEPESRPKGKK